jgi:hypothetical protein
MAMAEREPFCEPCGLPLAMCGHRAPVSRAAVAAAQTVGPVDWEHLDQLAEEGMTSDGAPFEAQYGGRCHGCGDRWEPGDQLAWSADDGELMHASCVHGGR